MSIDATSRLRAWILGIGGEMALPAFVADVEAVLDSNAKLLTACKAVWSEWSGSLNATDPDAEGYEVLRQVREAIESEEGEA